jgi:hypothetical protein
MEIEVVNITKKILKLIVKIVGVLVLLFFFRLAVDEFILGDFRSAFIFSFITVFLFSFLFKDAIKNNQQLKFLKTFVEIADGLVIIMGILILLSLVALAINAYANLGDFRSALVYSIFAGFLFHVLFKDNVKNESLFYNSENNQPSIDYNTEYEKSTFSVRELMKIGKFTENVLCIVFILWYYFAPDINIIECLLLYIGIKYFLDLLSKISRKIYKKDLPQSITVIISGFYLIVLITSLYYSVLSK